MGKLGDANGATMFYGELLQTLLQQRLPFLVGGAYGFAYYTGIRRPTKDLDIFIRRSDWPRLEQIARAAGYRTELTFGHWLGKVVQEHGFVDVIFNSGNGLSPVDDAWFEHAPTAQVLGLAVRLMPCEETIWTKAFIMERERFDGADVAHLIHACSLRMDWGRLLRRFGPHWRVLLSHLVLFGFIYPSDRSLLPRWMMDELGARLHAEIHGAAARHPVCGGTLLSREQYLPDVTHKGYADARLAPHGPLSAEQVAQWTDGICPSSSTSGG